MDLAPIRAAIEHATGHYPEEAPQTVGGGCINETVRLGEFFVKMNDPAKKDMFDAEAAGLQMIAATNTVRVPEVITSGATASRAFLVLEHLPLGGSTRRSQETLGRQLAAMHRATSATHGGPSANFIGATPQPNPPAPDWIAFFRDHRLQHMLTLAAARGYSFPGAAALLDRLEAFFPTGAPAPSLLHGDLWGGNAAALTDGTPVIFDPAAYFGDREADLAMTALFGGFSPDFYAAYDKAWPREEGHQTRETLYNLYHILNHAVLFGGGYAGQAQRMIDSLLQIG